MTSRQATPVDLVRLAIAIPAYGRASVIADSVADMAREARKEGLSIAFYVSDDTPDTSVEDALYPLIEAGAPVHYRRNSPSLGHDHNLVATLMWPNADHVWLLGSSFRAAPGMLASIVGLLGDQDLLLLNTHVDGQPATGVLRGEAGRALLRDVLWHQTLTGTTIYGSGVRNWVERCGDSLKIVPNFPQICIMLGFTSDHNAAVEWFNCRSLQWSGTSEGSYWRTRAVDVFAHNWTEAVSSFPVVVPDHAVADIVRAHSAKTDLFNTYNLVRLRELGQFRWSTLRHRGARHAMHLPLWKLVAILVLPIALLRWSGNALGRIKNRRSEA